MSQDEWPGFDRDDRPVGRTVRALVWRITLTILAPVVWLGFVLLFFAFWASALTVPQEIVVGVVSVLALFATLVVVWVSFGVRMARRWAAW
ncbi:MAG TPA: hypothetical protein VMG36_00885 [Thermoplasmata archaeon]|nr:hypothetical protein [Thermoplasmata archaeon]